MGRICDICNTDLGEQTDYNFNRHRNSNQCQANQNRKKLIKDSSQSIKTYFFKTSSLQPSGLGTTNLNEIHSKEATRSNPIDLIDDTVLVDSNDLMNNELNNHINPHKRKTYDDSVFDLSKKELKNSLVLLKFKRDVTERDYKILSCYVYCVWRVRNECKHGRDVDPFEIFKILFNKWFISITNI
jgi:hypothetical protein